jgi:hypothetical protein
VLAAASAPSAPARGGPINSVVAFTPRKGGSILRLQYSYTEADGHADIRHINASGVTGTYVYGLKEDLALFFTVPYVNRQVDLVVPKLGRIEAAHDGIGDLTLLVKYRFWQKDTRPRETYRWAALAGLNIRSGDSDFTSDSYDPIVGAVFTWRRDRNLLDADLIYQLNTGGGDSRHDTLRYDLAYSYQFAPAVYDPDYNYEWNAVAEINGRYTADGSHEVFLSPGLQYVTERWALEASIQLPVIQEFDSDGPETDYRLVVGVRFRW